MALPGQRGDAHENFILIAKLDNAKNISQVLKAVNFKEYAMVFGTENGLKITVEDSKSIQASAFIQSDVFQEFTITEESVQFKINLNVLLECLNIFGNSNVPGVTPALKMCYAGYGYPLILLLEEAGVLTDCSIKTQESEEILDFDFSNANVLNKIILRSECLKEIFTELDTSSEMIEFLLSPDSPYFRISTSGVSGDSQIDIPKDSDMIESFMCTAVAKSRYAFSHFKPAIKPLAVSQKVSIRTDERGLLCLQYMIKTEDNHICFVEYFCTPLVDVEGDYER